MAELNTVIVICDSPLHKDGIHRPAVEQRTIDVCRHCADVIDLRVGGAVECPDCGKRFKTTAGLHQHQTLSHGAEPVSVKGRKAAKRRARRRS